MFKIYSIVDGVVSFEDLTFIDEEENISISEYLIKNKLATRTEESFASKVLIINNIYYHIC